MEVAASCASLLQLGGNDPARVAELDQSMSHTRQLISNVVEYDAVAAGVTHPSVANLQTSLDENCSSGLSLAR